MSRDEGTAFDIKKAIKVKVQESRGCGLRKEGGMYLYGAGLEKQCDRDYIVIEACPVCGERPRFTRGVAKIDFKALFGEHRPNFSECIDGADCVICHPRENYNSYLMWVGKDYTMSSFMSEARRMGVSKRIAKIPSDFVIGQDWIYLARKSVKGRDIGLRLEGRKRVVDVIFYAFRPVAIEYILKKSDLTNERKIKDLVDRGITPVLEVERYVRASK